MLRSPALLFALLASGLPPTLAGIGTVEAAPRKKAAVGGKSAPACGARLLPLVVGNQWTYTPVAAPAPLPENLARLAPAAPKQIVITVTGVEKQGADTVVSLEEKHGFDVGKDTAKPVIVETLVKATITCNEKGKFDISPESFFFAGEPGGFFNLTFDKLNRKKETSLKLVKGTIGEAEWIEEIAAHFTREGTKGSDAKLSAGTLELERKFIPQQSEQVVTKMGTYATEKLGLTTTGRVVLDNALAPEGKPCTTKQLDPVKKTEVSIPTNVCDLPANWISQIWLSVDVGVVQTLNSYAHMYQLVDMQLK
ncbi:MAG: hypothetical protein M3680_24775 [Myxococcota bacterium]|nr:hypothetical protein [Myxococcota bacterium]